jgi:hypothetical protein
MPLPRRTYNEQNGEELKAVFGTGLIGTHGVVGGSVLPKQVSARPSARESNPHWWPAVDRDKERAFSDSFTCAHLIFVYTFPSLLRVDKSFRILSNPSMSICRWFEKWLTAEATPTGPPFAVQFSHAESPYQRNADLCGSRRLLKRRTGSADFHPQTLTWSTWRPEIIWGDSGGS